MKTAGVSLDELARLMHAKCSGAIVMQRLLRFVSIFLLLMLPFVACMDFGSDDDDSGGCGGPYSIDLNSCSGVVCPDDGNPCSVEYCSSGSCLRRDADDGTLCSYDGEIGVCVDGVCGENLCEGVSCDDEPCREGICDFVDGLCDYVSQSPDGTPCVDAEGLAGVCVEGVCDVIRCDSSADCDDGNECTQDLCTDGVCKAAAVEDGTVCRDGESVCRAGRCVGPLSWPIDCVPGQTCDGVLHYPDIDEDGRAFDCVSPTYCCGTGVGISWEQMDAGVDVLAAAPGEVLWVFDGKYDRCPDPEEPDCQAPPSLPPPPGNTEGNTVCTELGDYCGEGTCCCYWCFTGGNVVVIRHVDVPGVFATRYDHLKNGSIVVSEGELVEAGQKIAEVGSSGASTGPELYFEVWGTGFYQLADPWAGPCGSNLSNPLWAFDPPWSQQEP